MSYEPFLVFRWLHYTTRSRTLAQLLLIQAAKKIQSVKSDSSISSLALQSEGARREMASSSGDKSPTPETLGTPEVVVVFEQPNATAPEASDRLSKKQTPGIEFPEVHHSSPVFLKL